MKIAILTSGILPVPAVGGGAVENLIDFYLDYNDRHHLHDITVYSIGHPKIKTHPALTSKVNHYRLIDTSSLFARIKRKIFSKQKKYFGPYHYTVGYFLEESIKHLRKQDYDVIILENRPFYAIRLNKVTDSKLVFHLHNEKIDFNTKDGQVIYDAASRIITVSDYIGNCIKADIPSDTKCITVHNGIDTHAFSPALSTQISRKDLNIDADDFVLIFSGRIHPEKGILQLIDALVSIQPQPHIKLLIIGSPFYGNAQLKGESDFVSHVRERAQAVADKITFTGFIPYAKIPNYLKLADVAVIPSVWDDPFPTTVLEAQAMGMPIIATRRGGIPEEVSDNNAILLNTDEQFVEHLAKAILELYENPDRRKAMADESVRRSTLFDKDTYAQNFFAAIEGLKTK